MKTAPTFASAREAMEMVQAGLGYLATVDATAMAAETQAHCLQMLEQAHATYTAARTSMLAAFTAGQGYCADADYSPRAWLINKTRITKGAAVAYTAWVRRAAAHPEVAAALAAGEMSESFARSKRMRCATRPGGYSITGSRSGRSCGTGPGAGSCRWEAGSGALDAGRDVDLGADRGIAGVAGSEVPGRVAGDYRRGYP